MSIQHFLVTRSQSATGCGRVLLTTRAMALAASTALVVVLAVSQTNAQIVVDSPQTTTVTVIGNQTLTITENGSITTAGGDDAVVIDGNGNFVTSFGPISADGTGFLVDGGTGNEIFNAGNVATLAGTSPGFDIEGDQNTVTNSGSISTQGGSSDAIEIDGNNNLVFNSGRILTLGGSALAFEIDGNGNTVTNSGDISTQSGSSDAFDIAGDDNIVSNSGNISTSGGSAPGFDVDGTGNTITNSGSVSTQGSSADGFEIRGSKNTVTNFGNVTALGSSASGFDVGGNDHILTNSGDVTSGSGAFEIDGDRNRVSNSGSVSTQDGSAAAFEIDGDDNVLTNTGSVATQGNSSDGFAIDGNGNTVSNTAAVATIGSSSRGLDINGDDNIITNSGSFVSTNSDAIRFGGGSDDNTLNLLAPSFIGGAIDLTNGTNTTLNIVTGPSQSIFWTLETDSPTDLAGNAPSFSGTVPTFYNAVDQTVATFDPTLLSTEAAALGDLTNLLSQVGLGAIDGFGLGLGSDPSTGFAPLGFMPLDSDDAHVTERLGRAWVTALGGRMDYDGSRSTLDSTVTQAGFALGYTWQRAPDLILNAMAGYAARSGEADATWSPSFDHDTDTFFAGLHGEHALGLTQFGQSAVQFGLTAGYAHTDHNRFVNDNLAPLGQSWVSADYGGLFLSPELGLSSDIAMAVGTVLTPNAGLRYAAQWLDGYTETGAVSAAANATVEDRFVGVLETRIGLDVTRDFAFGTLTGRIGYLGRWSTGDGEANITLNGLTQTVASDAQNLNAVTLGATLRGDLGETAFLELDANYLHGDTAQGFDGRITVGMAF